MSLEATIRAALVTALGASVTAVKEAPIEAGDVLPLVTYLRVDTPRRHALGPGNPVIASRPRFQFDLWTASPESRDVVAPLLVTALCALPYALTLTGPANSHNAETGWFRARIDATVAHGGA